MPSRIAALTLTAVLAYAQSVEMRPQLKVGDAFTLEIQRVRTLAPNPDGAYDRKTTAWLRVVGEQAGSLVLEWESGVPVELPLNTTPSLAAAAKSLAGQKLLIKFSPEGKYIGLQNEEEVIPKLRSYVEAMMDDTLMRVSNASQLMALYKLLLQPEVLLSSLTRELGIYFTPLGLAIKQGETIAQKAMRPMPPYETVIPATVRIAAEKIDNAEVTLSLQTIFDPESVMAEVKRIAEATQGKIPDSLPDLDVKEGGTYVYDRSLGLMRSVSYTRTSRSSGTVNTEVWNIRLVTPPSR